ncbi:antifreeze protein [Pseudoroseicyclus tamaricis]|uniref:Antifreeze protein n=1 Tax=Pseudoroseicyclus tamaricis TaxID=2705421 RepID=A0A6B2JFX0_9RHOB|nr:antifreeze protein [Pseudoroseicyclus tamaricis]NDU99982.1 antifreeze protein [Pseudoroseicyclus tamaricis]
MSEDPAGSMAEAMDASFRFWTMAAEAQRVAAMRVMGMMGVWPVALNESSRMWEEKGDAFTRAWFAGAAAGVAGASPAAVFTAALAPIGVATKANYKRLSGGEK